MEAPKSLILLFFLLFAFYFLSTSIADDGAAMLALAKSFSHPPTDWSATTSSNNYCRWTDISCISGRVSIVNLEKHGLVGFVSPTIANLTSLKSIYLNDNKLTGIIPKELTFMTSLRLIDVSNNNLTGKIPKFPASVNFIYKPGNSLLGTIAGDSSTKHGTGGSWSVLMACVITFAITIFLWRFFVRRLNGFNEDNILGSGGFGVVYSGKLQDETKVAVKRMNLSSLGGERMKQFVAEVSLLAKVRHRHVIALLGYSVNGDERLLVYEHMSQRNLGHHLFEPAKHGYFPLTWKQRVRIALDVAQGVEYLHKFAPQSSIHRDLKSSTSFWVMT
ncbi:PREDICTED: receptor-like kinase TMK4 [Camelina sativa]|uniref:Receptor-like kinase TMK4 n=1 Tax=Camelina sativa TaxID=90675 RepID=A0ABM0WB40_CAMSA|nr:PREDICTED: receptor-like kinase TMK4 [Camelina sativa]